MGDSRSKSAKRKRATAVRKAADKPAGADSVEGDLAAEPAPGSDSSELTPAPDELTVSSDEEPAPKKQQKAKGKGGGGKSKAKVALAPDRGACFLRLLSHCLTDSV
jgi:hypothetical protein